MTFRTWTSQGAAAGGTVDLTAQGSTGAGTPFGDLRGFEWAVTP